MARWSAEDHWVDKREEFQAQVSQDVMEKVRGMIEEARVEQIQSMGRLYHDILAKLDEKVTLPDGREVPLVMPSSFEGMVNALVRLSEAQGKLRDQLAKEVSQVRPGAPGQTHGMVTPTLADDEARESAKLIMRMRREKARARMAKGKAKDEPSPQPKLRLVEGESDG